MKIQKYLHVRVNSPPLEIRVIRIKYDKSKIKKIKPFKRFQMKPKNFDLIPKNKNIYKASLILLLLVGTIVACRKSFDPSTSNSDPQVITVEFNAMAAKEWFYGSFKKSTEYASYYSAKTTETARYSSKPSGKLPDWTRSTYRKVGRIEIVEFPLIKAKTTMSVPTAGLSKQDVKRIAEASLTRLAIIKNPNGKILVREIYYIPESN